MNVTLADDFRGRHDRLLRRLRDVAAANGHDPERLRIVGVTKTHRVEVAAAAHAAGITRLGESRVQEAEPKVQALPDAEWHLVGRLQSNKVRRAVRSFAVIHSVDSVALLRRVGEVAAEEGRRPAVLVQVNVSGEAAKAGMRPDEIATPEGVAAIRDAGVIGLMTIAPLGVTMEEARTVFGALRRLRDHLEESAALALPELSMGMSGDAEAAAAEGATLVRIGTAIFGSRA